MSQVIAKLLDPARRMPLVITAVRKFPIGELLDRYRPKLMDQLIRHGALVFRNFDVVHETDFADFIGGLGLEGLEYKYRSTPRRQRQGAIYTATEYPPEREIPLHNENSYQRVWPRKLAFCCLKPAEAGGATSMADILEVQKRLGSDIFGKFKTLGVRYDRAFHNSVDLPWEEVFQTNDKAEVERYCRENGISYSWHDNGVLKTSQLCPGIVIHNETGEEFLFNQAHLFHPSSLGEDVWATMEEVFGSDLLPRNARFGDGSPLRAATLKAIRSAYENSAVDLEWQKGDIALLDNVQVAHGRRAYQGDRVVLASLLEPGRSGPVHMASGEMQGTS
ncbi:TauD/TfdA family dioxygenase [Sphingomonas sp. LB2R24]|uniref:TauD/TfdA family dioxygenase n=1 Tax=Sphingomonas sorbitolis TaxID=3096165 RepID=UPI002FC64353